MRLSARRPSRRTLNHPLRLEQLEDRTLLAGNLIITAEVPSSFSYNLMEYTQQGALVNSQSIPQAPGATETEHARGLSVGPSGDVNVFDGTSTPSLATLSASTSNWSFQTSPGWNTVNNLTFGGVVAYKNYIFASDMGSDNGQSYGLVRFDSSGGPAVQFAPGSSSIQVTLGLDGQLYELVSTSGSAGANPTIQVFNPDTLDLVRSFTLNTGPMGNVRSIAVDSAGNVFAADWTGTVTKYDANGNPTGTSIVLHSPYGYTENLINIALDTDGQIAVGGRAGDVFLTDESLSSVQTIQTNQANVFVTFDHYIGTAPQAVTPTFTMLAGPTITYGQSSMTLGGQISAGSAVPPGNVNITVAGTTETAAINDTDGTFSAVFNTAALSVGSYTIQYSYAGGGNFTAANATATLQVSYAVHLLPIAPKEVHAGAALPIKLQVTDASGNNLSSADLTVTAISLIGPDGTTYSPNAKGHANLNNVFRHTRFGYRFNLDTAGLAPGTYTLMVQVGNDPVLHAVSFVVVSRRHEGAWDHRHYE